VRIEGAIGNTAQGVELSAKVSATLTEIVTKAREMDELAAEVAGASREQSTGISQVNNAVGQMDKVTQANAASAEESAAAAEILNGQAHRLRQMVGDLVKLIGDGATAAPDQTAAATSAPALPTTRKAGLNGGHPVAFQRRRESAMVPR
jgi:hypothetical protein